MKSDLFSLGFSVKDPEKFYLFCLTKIHGLGNNIIFRLLKEYGQPSSILASLLSLPPGIQNLIAKQSSEPGWPNSIISDYEKLPDNCFSILDSFYPDLLKNIYDPPIFLFYKGNLDLLKSTLSVTIVGSRQISNYHQNTVQQLISALAVTDLILTSGLAVGIDALVHQNALENNLQTIAVLGSGLDKGVLYPGANLKLAEKIIGSGGLLLSEYPNNTKATIYNFPRRNRILAGLSKTTVVISGAAKSGTLITAQIALDEGREVLALPGNINQTLCQGPNSLIKQGANLLLSADDILKTYNLKSDKLNKEIKFSSARQQLIYSLLQIQPLTVNELTDKLSIDLVSLNQTISEMELSGLITTNQVNQLEIN